MIMHDDGTASLWQEIVTKRELGGNQVFFFENISSTNTVALEKGKNGAPAGTLVVADAQEGGRGRLGRSWVSPPGAGLYFSMITRPRLCSADLPKITLAVGLALCIALEKSLGIMPEIKWPNDILLAGKKCGGILTEAAEIRADTALVVIGVGLNLTTPLALFPPELQAKVTSLHKHVEALPDRGVLLLALVGEIAAVLRRLEQGEFFEILAGWRKRDATLGKTLNWLTPGGAIVTGISEGPDENGQLQIRDREGHIHPVLSGDLSLKDGREVISFITLDEKAKG